MPNTTGLAVRVGIFVLGALILLIGFSLQVSGGFLRGARYDVSAYFDSTVGLAEGSQVYLNGVNVGNVREVSFDSSRRQVRVGMDIDARTEFPDDSVARIDRSAFLGNATIVIHYGESDRMLARGGELGTEETPGFDEIIKTVAELGDEARSLFESFRGSQGDLFQTIQDILDENREDIRTAAQSLADSGPKLEELTDELQALAADVREGRGTIGKLFTDEELYDDLKAFSEEAKRFATDLREGEGTLSRLIYDDALAIKAEESFEQIAAAGEEVQRLLSGREDDIQRMFDTFADLGPRLEQAMERLTEITRKLEEGEGTLGLMINDPSLYEDTRRAVNQISESFESAEEQGVVRSFFGILFGAII